MNWDDERHPAPPPASDEWRKSPGKKDTKHWCKGKVGREHVPEIVLPSWVESLYASRNREICYWREDDWVTKFRGVDRYYTCQHEERCKTCGKVLSWTIDKTLCPDYRQ